MKKAQILSVIIVLFLALTVGAGRGYARVQGAVSASSAIGTGFTYQGQLKNSGGSPITSTCTFDFSLYDALSGGTQIGGTSTVSGVSVVNGYFTTLVNSGGEFGAGAFNGEARWLQIAVKCTGDAAPITLNPLQPLTPAPYALALPGLRTEENAYTPNVIGGYIGNTVASGVYGATIGGGGWSGYINSVTGYGSFGTVSGGYGNTASGSSATVGGGLNNAASETYTTVGGGEGNLASSPHASVGGGYKNTASNHHATVGGGSQNTASSQYSTVGGGKNNTASGDNATVGGGHSNTAGFGGTVGGGESNTASAGGTVGGGQNNAASGTTSTVGGGLTNAASTQDSTVGGGTKNTASGLGASIGGGAENTASGDWATVAGGVQASATHYGEAAHASGQFVSPTGEAQASEYVLRSATSDATETELFLDGVSQRITLVSSRTLSFDILIVAHSSGGASAGYRITGLIENVAGTTTFVGTQPLTVLGEDAPVWNVTVVADNANDALEIKVTGAAGTNIRWVASVRTVEVSW
jgi:hypothetical protein